MKVAKAVEKTGEAPCRDEVTSVARAVLVGDGARLIGIVGRIKLVRWWVLEIPCRCRREVVAVARASEVPVSVPVPDGPTLAGMDGSTIEVASEVWWWWWWWAEGLYFDGEDETVEVAKAVEVADGPSLIGMDVEWNDPDGPAGAAMARLACLVQDPPGVKKWS